jgi:hypothetical protein
MEAKVHMRLFVPALLAALFAAAPASAQKPKLKDYHPVPGIPEPAFGITEQAGAATYYVDNTHPRATDDGNPNGTPSRPRATIPGSVPAGSVVEVHGGPYNIGNGVWSADGTASEPVFIEGVGDPVIRGERIAFAGAYLLVEGFVFDGIPLVMSPTMSHLAIRGNEVKNWSPSGHSTAVVPAGSDIVVFGNEIHNNGDPNSASENDVHGVKAEAGAARIWILLNHIHHNGGDGIQLGNATSLEPWPQQIYIGQNLIHQDRENAVDIKKARDVIVSSNVMFGYQARSSSAGEVVVTHDGAQRIWIVDNAVGNSNQGIVCTGADVYIVVGNVINAIQHNPGDKGYDPNSLFRTAGILTYNTTNSSHTNNTIWNSDAGISYAGGTAATEIVNNIIGARVQPSHDIAIGNSQAVSSSHVAANMIDGSARVRMAGAAGGCPRSVCREVSVDLVNAPKDMRLKAGSPAIDAGVTPTLYAAFKQAYGQDIAVDLAGTPRPQGAAFDIGAAEFATGKPPAPKNPRIVPKPPTP